MSQCSRCKKTIKFFGKSFSCDECDFTVCEQCESQLKECEECDGLYCPIHILKHECVEDESSDDDNLTVNEIKDKIKSLNEKELLRLIVFMECESKYEDDLFGDFSDLLDTVKEKK